MSVISPEVIVYGCANMPEIDTGTMGGAPDITRRLSFSDMLANGLLDAVSSSASDTGVNCKLIYAVRDGTGTIVNETLQLNGTTKVAGTKTAERIEYVATSTATAGGPLASPGTQAPVGDVALMAHTLSLTARTAQAGSANKTGTTPALFKLQAGDGATITALANAGVAVIIRTTGGTGLNQLRQVVASSGYGTDFVAVNRDWGTLPDATTTYEVASGALLEILPNPVTAVIRAFATAAADAVGGASRVYYEKGFILNTNAATALTSAQIIIQAESPSLPGAAALDIALANASGAGATLGLNDSVTVAQRLNPTAPTGTTAFTSGAPPQSINVPNTNQSLPSGNAAANAQGCWLRLTLPAGTTSYKGAGTVRTAGSTV